MSSDRPGADSPDDQPSSPRRSRRAGRSSDSYDFRDRFGDTGRHPRAEGLREPTGREQYVRPRGRLTVRQLMDQMGVDESAGTLPPAQVEPPATGRRRATPPPTPPRPTTPPPSAPAPRPAAQAPRPSAPQESNPAPPSPQRRPATPPAARPQPRPAAPKSEATQAIPPIAGFEFEPVDLSDTTTASRASDESRAQSPTPPKAPSDDAPAVAQQATDVVDAPKKIRRRPLEPTPDLTQVIERVRPRKAPLTKKARARKVATGTGRTLVALACILSLVGTGYVWNMNRVWNGNWNNVFAIDPDSKDVRNKDAQYGDETYLIVGTDTRSGQNAKVGAGEADTVEGARADTILLVNVPADRSRVVAVSWPRDLAVDRPECQNWNSETKEYDGVLPAANSVKLNGVFADGGPSCIVKTLTQMSGLNINHFIAMDFAGFEHVVRAVGGVEVCSKVPLFDDEIGYIVKTPGRKKLTPKQSLNYVRARHIALEGNGDYGRIKRQQLFMSSLLRSTLSGDVLSNPSKLNGIVKTFIKYSYVDRVDTDALINLADSMQGMDAGAVTFLTIPTSGTSEDGQNNEIPRTDDIDAIFNAIIDDQPLPGEKKKRPADAPAPTTKAPANTEMTAQHASNITARVLNGTGQPGMASNVMDELIRQGVEVSGIGDASEQRTDTVVRYGTGERDSAATIAKLFPGAKIQLDKSVKSGVQVILGSDFGGVETMGSVPAAGSTLSVEHLPENVNSSNLPNDLAVTNAGDTTCS
ncbi:LCP family protein [Gordonia malaquae]|uniref:LCP family protein n=1 Tax=Gordonia malaquae TaxID=410332 RepID=UPI0030FEF176